MFTIRAHILVAGLYAATIGQLGCAAEVDPFAAVSASADMKARVERMIADSKDHFVCAGIGLFAPRTAPADSPVYFFSEASRVVLSVCGGACWRPRTDEQKFICASRCPPPEWKAGSCEEKRKEFYLAQLPDLTQEKARQKAASLTGCNNPRIKCELKGEREGDNWVFDIVYTAFQDPASEDWAKRFGMTRVLLGIKGQLLRYRDFSGKDR